MNKIFTGLMAFALMFVASCSEGTQREEEYDLQEGGAMKSDGMQPTQTDN
jgi:hypothetical protein